MLVFIVLHSKGLYRLAKLAIIVNKTNRHNDNVLKQTDMSLYYKYLWGQIDYIYRGIKTINWKNCYDVEGGVYLCIRNEGQSSITKQKSIKRKIFINH